MCSPLGVPEAVWTIVWVGAPPPPAPASLWRCGEAPGGPPAPSHGNSINSPGACQLFWQVRGYGKVNGDGDGCGRGRARARGGGFEVLRKLKRLNQTSENRALTFTPGRSLKSDRG